MTPSTALVLVVFGRGVRCADDRYTLTPASIARVRAAADYVAAHESHFLRSAARGPSPRIVLAGGWAEACEGATPPPAGSREGDLMLREARAAGLDRYAELRVETRSRSTLENLVHTVEEGLLAGWDFDARRPLGIVSHAWHLPRIRFLAGKVLGLRGSALVEVPAEGGEPPGGERSERAARIAARLAFLGVGDAPALVRRERAMVAVLRRAERWVRRDRGAGLPLGG
ncbi:ElyC/SanA/YdcF family protein [Micromonospora sp. RTP1Z1]|uniref:ElyC/SanA/YdcF family protein n=1 Tax=Micromonospora sp. RTP1Z1 TaxID=2994043 RepID=UPI0029C795A5|nr:ElyC/SanA/YdcF family protein [Micromonospora sp. RTP1Z1]